MHHPLFQKLCFGFKAVENLQTSTDERCCARHGNQTCFFHSRIDTRGIDPPNEWRGTMRPLCAQRIGHGPTSICQNQQNLTGSGLQYHSPHQDES